MAEASFHSTEFYETLITRIESKNDQWWITTDQGTDFGPFPAILLTLPAPQAADLCGRSGICTSLAESFATVEYHRQFSFIFGWDRRLVRPEPYHALLNLDRKHDIAWLSFEDDKPGHVPAGKSVMVIQMSPAWSRKHFDADRQELAGYAWEKVRSLVSPDLPDPSWWDVQRWKYAHPTRKLDRNHLVPWEKKGLFYAGDALAGKGRVTLAIKEGLAAGRRMIDHLQDKFQRGF